MLLDYLQKEKDALKSVKVHRFSALYDRIRSYEAGAPIPEEFCPTEERRSLIDSWIAESQGSSDPLTRLKGILENPETYGAFWRGFSEGLAKAGHPELLKDIEKFKEEIERGIISASSSREGE